MAKLTVFFKDKATCSRLFENGIVHIGRDETNDLIIDSLAVAPAHAVIVIRDIDTTIKQLNKEYPLIINSEKIETAALHNGDIINIGKHKIIFTDSESVDDLPLQMENLIKQDVLALNKEIEGELHIPTANLQIISGSNIGKILPLKNALTRLGKADSGIIAIVKRKDGYFVSALDRSDTITLNNNLLGNNSAQLHNNDILVVGDTSMQFFMS